MEKWTQNGKIECLGDELIREAFLKREHYHYENM